MKLFPNLWIYSKPFTFCNPMKMKQITTETKPTQVLLSALKWRTRISKSVQNRRHSFNFIFSEPLFDDIDSVCVGSVVFAGVIGSLAFVALLSSVIVSLLCLKMRRLKDTEASVDSLNAKEHVRPRPSTTFIPGSGANSIASLDTLRSRTTKSEYVHSTQARIPWGVHKYRPVNNYSLLDGWQRRYSSISHSFTSLFISNCCRVDKEKYWKNSSSDFCDWSDWSGFIFNSQSHPEIQIPQNNLWKWNGISLSLFQQLLLLLDSGFSYNILKVGHDLELYVF